MKKRGFQLALFLFLLLIVEVVLRISGHKPGVLNNRMFPVDSVIYEPLFQTDSFGITSYIPDSPFLPIGFSINDQGFRSEFNFTAETIDSLKDQRNQKVVMLVGDSYTEGCCALPIDSSFPDFLQRDQKYILLNFGIGATDLVQYKQVVRKYIPEVRPDLLVVAFYLGNDIAHYHRPIAPFIPASYNIKDYHWLMSYGPPYYMENWPEQTIESAEKAYQFYLSNFTLWGDDANFFEKGIRNSVVCSKIYLFVRELYYRHTWGWKNYQKNDDVMLTNGILREINEICQANGTKLFVVGIPTPKNVKDRVNLKEEYGKYFIGLNHLFPNLSGFSTNDYDGLETANHFNNSGHYKYYLFLREVLQKELSLEEMQEQ